MTAIFANKKKYVWAIRIGKWPTHLPYYYEFFTTRQAARNFINEQKNTTSFNVTNKQVNQYYKDWHIVKLVEE